MIAKKPIFKEINLSRKYITTRIKPHYLIFES